MTATLVSMKDELSKTTASNTFIRHQSAADTRRKEKEISKLQQAVFKISEKGIVKCSFTISTPLPLVIPLANDLNRETIIGLQDSITQMQTESHALKSHIASVYEFIDALVRDKEDIYMNESLDASKKSFLTEIEYPFDHAVHSISARTTELFDLLTGMIQPPLISVNEEHEARIQRMQSQIGKFIFTLIDKDQLRDIVKDQVKLIEQAAVNTRQHNEDIQDLSLDGSDTVHIDEKMKALNLQELKLDQDRNSFTQAAIRMGKERAQLQVILSKLYTENKKDRESFEQTVRTFENQKLLSQTPM